MDFGKFKKVSSNQSSTTLQHPDGHKIRVAHAALGKEARAELDAQPMCYADGGEAQKPKEPQAKEPDFVDKALDWVHQNAPNLLSPVAMQSAQQTSSLSPAAGPAVGQAMQQLPAASSQAPEQAPTNYSVPTVQQSVPAMPNSVPGQSGLKQAIGGINDQAKAMGAQGAAESQASQQYQGQQLDLNAHYQAKTNELNDERAKLVQDFKDGHIDPNHFTDSLGTGGKVRTAIGLILGGLGSGLAHIENPAMKFLNSQIDRDIDAQKANLGKTKTLLEFNEKQFGNLKDATAMTRAHLLDMYSAQIADAGAQAKGPLAQAIAKQRSGELKMQADQLTAGVAQSQAVRQAVANGSMGHEQALPFVVPEKQRGEVAKAIADGRANEQMRAWADENANKLTGMIGKGMFSPNARQALVEPLAGFIEKTGEGRFNYDQAVNIAHGFLPSKTDSEETIKLKERQRQQFFDGQAAKHNSLIQSGGLPPLPSSRRVVKTTH